MRSRTAHFVCLLLLLSSLAVSDARTGRVEPVRTPGGVFVHNLLLHAVVEESEPAALAFGDEERLSFIAHSQPIRSLVTSVRGPVEQTAHVHAVTGNSL